MSVHAFQATLSVGLRRVAIENRKYIGSKQNLIGFIHEVISAAAPAAAHALDLFAGSGVVAYGLAERGLQVVANDHLYSNYVTNRCFLTSHAGNADWSRVAALIAELNALPGQPGYISLEYGGTYFTLANAARMDAIRGTIAGWQAAGRITEHEGCILLTSLLYAIDKVANTCGQYDAFLKHLGQTPYHADGTHRVDACVYGSLELGLPLALPDGHRHQAHGQNADLLADRIEADLVYLDPPYNTRQYVDNYHVLENIARWQKPDLQGKTRKFPRHELRSAYSSKRHAAGALSGLIARLRCRHLLLSYNNEGIVPDAVILAAMASRGPVEVFERGYPVFGRGAGRARSRQVVERIFYCRVENPPGDPGPVC